MYHFAVVALFGLATLKLADLLVELVPSLGKTRTILSFAVAIAAMLAVDHSLFAGFGVELRESWMGTVATGAVVGALAGAWSTVLGWLESGRTETTERRSGRRPPHRRLTHPHPSPTPGAPQRRGALGASGPSRPRLLCRARSSSSSSGVMSTARALEPSDGPTSRGAPAGP